MENKMVIAIRVDSSIEIGSGHVMRCLTLAEQLKFSGSEVFFICSELAGNMSELIRRKGYVVFSFRPKDMKQSDYWKFDLEYTKRILFNINKQLDWLIVDHYMLDVKWEKPLRCYAKKIMVVDDSANRQHDCDVLFDQNLYLDMEKRYSEFYIRIPGK